MGALVEGRCVHFDGGKLQDFTSDFLFSLNLMLQAGKVTAGCSMQVQHFLNSCT